MNPLRVGFIGLGSQGGPMARRIAEEDHPVTLWARRSGSLEAFKDLSVDIAASPADLGAACDVVGVCVVDDAGIEDVLLRPDGVLAGMAPGGAVLVHSTVHPDTCRRMADEAAQRGIDLLDAPVSGGGIAAADRRLLVMAGGDADVLERCRPVLETFAGEIVHLGDVGAGQLAKLLNNLVFTALLGIGMDTFALAADIGVDRHALAKVLESGSGGSRAASILAMTDFDTSGMTSAGVAALLRKDVGLALDLARAADAAPTSVLADAATNTVKTLEGLG